MSVILHEGVSVFHSIDSDICGATTQRASDCDSMAKLPIFITFWQRHSLVSSARGKALLRFHTNNGYANAPHHYVVFCIAYLVLTTLWNLFHYTMKSFSSEKA